MSTILELDSDKLSGGHWITIDGAHVYIKGDTIVAGPKGIEGKTLKQAASDGKQVEEVHGEEHPSSKKLKPAEKNAIADYTGDKFQQINDHLRKGGDSKDIEGIVSKMDSGLAKVADHPGDVYRHITLTPELQKQIDAGEISDKAFSSATTRPGIVHTAPTKGQASIQIVGGGGKNISSLSDNPGEAEVLFPRGTKFKIESVKAGKYGGTHIVARVVKSKTSLDRATGSTVLILNADTAAFADAMTLGQGLPKEKNGLRCGYFWKESLPLGTYRDKNGKAFEVTPQRIENLILNFNRAKAKGFLPRVPNGHDTTDATKNLGFVLDARKNAKGNLELMTQMIGEDAILATARNKASICTIGNHTDETGEAFDELIDHLAIVPDPQLNNLEDFQPLLAASRAAAAETVILQLAADEQESQMELKALREAIGAKQEVTDADVIAQAVAKLGEGTKALELSRTSGETIQTLTKRATDAEKARDDANAKVLELSKGGPDPVTLEDRRQTAEEVLAGFVERGQCTDAMAKVVRENFLLEADGKANLMLSRGARSGPVGAVFKILELNKALGGFQQTPSQPVGRQIPGGDGTDLGKIGLEQGKAYQEQQLASRGVK